MRVRMTATISGPVDGVDLPPRGHEIDVPDHIGAALCDNGQAAPVAVNEKVETAAVDESDVEARTQPSRRAAAKKAAGTSGKDTGGN